MEFRSFIVMAYILMYCQDNNIVANRTKAQKLLYCCYGAILAEFNERLTDEHPKAWMYGPVFPRTFNDINKKRLTVAMAEEFRKDCPSDWLVLINKTLNTFGGYTASALSNWSHVEGSPWSKADSLASLDDREVAIYFSDYLPIIDVEGNGIARAT